MKPVGHLLGTALEEGIVGIRVQCSHGTHFLLVSSGLSPHIAGAYNYCWGGEAALAYAVVSLLLKIKC